LERTLETCKGDFAEVGPDAAEFAEERLEGIGDGGDQIENGRQIRRQIHA
jgi:hypothetical protein